MSQAIYLKNNMMYLRVICAALVMLCATQAKAQKVKDKIKGYVASFNAFDNEAVINNIANKDSYEWMVDNVPYLDCPDEDIEKIYYFRWWSFRKHIKDTPDGTIVTEFIEPVKHAAKYNAISCALGHHLYEGRWLKNTDFLNEYVDFWLYKADIGEDRPRFHQFSSWLPDALLAFHMVHPQQDYLSSRLEDLDKDYKKWQEERQTSSRLFWQHDVQDGMEESVSGGRKEQNKRPTINSYMPANAKALSTIADLAGNKELSAHYQKEYTELRELLIDSLWDENDEFFKTKLENGELHRTREAIGYVPWYFNLPPDNAKYAKAWSAVLDTLGFDAPWGLTTAERREPTFRTRGSGHGCEWDGALWPFASTQTLRGMGNFLSSYENHGELLNEHFYYHLQKYAKSHVMNGHPYIGEYQDEVTGYWLKGDNPRSKFYNHSTYADLVIQDLIGLKPQLDDKLVLSPLIPQGTWAYFALTNLDYKGKELEIYWDETGDRYNKGKGFIIYLDHKKVHQSSQIEDVSIHI